MRQDRSLSLDEPGDDSAPWKAEYDVAVDEEGRVIPANAKWLDGRARKLGELRSHEPSRERSINVDIGGPLGHRV
jgi:hypothetical protein